MLAGPGGRRTVPARDFFVDYLTTALRRDEMLVEVRVPKLAGWGMHYEKFHRIAQAWAIVGVAAAVRRENGPIAEARIGLTNMGPTPVRATATEEALAGADAGGDAIAEAARHAAEGTAPSDDLNAPADYRRHLARVLTRRAVTAAGRDLTQEARVQLENSFTVPVPVDEAWRVLLDIERIAPCMPGAVLDSVDRRRLHRPGEGQARRRSR